MHRIALFALGTILLAPPSTASAALFVDVDDESHLRTVDPGETVSGTFDIVNPGDDCLLVLCDQGGFDPAVHQLDAAVVSFTFFDHGDIDFLVDLGSGSQTLSSPSTASLFSMLHFEIGWLNDGALADLGSNGLLAWSLTNTDASAEPGSPCFFGYACGESGGDDFVLESARIVAVAAPIPEPSGALLFAAGFGVVGSAIRRPRHR